MSRRTAEANKAIREAWENEQQRVAEGKGTRDWTPEQQQSILDLGKAYDEDGKAFIGHHMKSAEAYPEYQGDPENIQFLSYDEHFKAHDGNWRNPSNWYYDPKTGEKHEFGDNKYAPCEVIGLSEPISHIIPDVQPETKTAETVADTLPKAKTSTASTTENHDSDKQDNYLPPPYVPQVRYEPERKKGFSEKVGDAIGEAVKWVKDFHEEHPVLSKVVDGLILIGGKAAVDSALSKRSGTKTPGHTLSTDHNFLNDLSNTLDGQGNSSSDLIDSISSKDYPNERSSPIEHAVSGYTRQQNGKTVDVKPYKRGGNT